MRFFPWHELEFDLIAEDSEPSPSFVYDNNYQSIANPQYWKNRKPFEGYWQQDVYYKIKANIDEKTDILSGSEELIYTNNSPDTLTFLFFHLYNNAFQPGSYYDQLHNANNLHPTYGKWESQKKGIEISSMTIDGQELIREIDNTIMKVYLPKPLLPGQSIKIHSEFKSYFDGASVRRRNMVWNAYGYKHYNGVHWYPRIAVYDRKFGWETDQHLGREFYGDFGIFDVELTFANNFIIECTGALMNEAEVLPTGLRAKLDIGNFQYKPWEEKPSVIIPYDSTQRKTWKYQAVNVHDVAFTADPTYRIGESNWNGIRCIALVEEPHAARWQDAPDFIAKVIRIYSEDFGMYVYPKIVVADARDGMEYPMLTLCGGGSPDYHGLLAHEIGHNWFYGQVGSNETYRAMLDEGFTQFLTAWSLQKIDGDTLLTARPRSNYADKFLAYQKTIDNRVYNAYMQDAITMSETTLNTHSDGYNGALKHGGGYGMVYYKTSTMLYNLQYVLGDSLFLKAMKHYFTQWKICHPYIEDFRNSIIQYTHEDLNWFFDQWIETPKRLDYAVKSIKKGENKNEYFITLKRKERMQMPIDLRVISKKDSVYDFHIPNTWFTKNTDATLLPKWYGWDVINPTYTTKINIPGGISNVIIDPTQRLGDAYMLDNSKKFPVHFYFDSQIYNTPNWRWHEIYLRPDLWYNGFDGFKYGVHFNGSYLQYFHKFDANIWFNSGMIKQPNLADTSNKKANYISYRFNYNTALNKFSKNARIFLSSRFLDGLNLHQAMAEKKDDSGKNRFFFAFKSMWRVDSIDLNYLLFPEEWQPAKYNNTLTAGLQHTYTYAQGKGDMLFKLRSSTVGGNYNYAQLSLAVINETNLGRFQFRTRTFMQYGSGNNVPDESALFLSGANPEEMMENKYTRSVGFFDNNWDTDTENNWTGYGISTNHFHYGGGLNLRGYAGYLAPFEAKDGEVYLTYKGNTGASVNMELDFDGIFDFHPKITRRLKMDTYLFADAGIINYNYEESNFQFSNIRMNAGIGTALTIKNWGVLQKAKPLTIRLDFPLFLNQTPAVTPDFFQFRWVIGVNRAF
jgi:aminopeptidase N